MPDLPVFVLTQYAEFLTVKNKNESYSRGSAGIQRRRKQLVLISFVHLL